MAYETVGDIIENRDKLRNDLAAVTAERDRLRARVAELEAAAQPPADEFGYINAWLNTASELGDEGPLAERMATRLMAIAEDDDLPVIQPAARAAINCANGVRGGDVVRPNVAGNRLDPVPRGKSG